MPPRSDRHLRSPRWLACLAPALAVSTGAMACGGDVDGARDAGPKPEATAGTAEAPAFPATAAPTEPAPPATTAPDPEAARPDPVRDVQREQVTYDDRERGRTLLTTVYWPERGVRVRSDALVLVAHGYSLPGWGYETLARQIAAAGFVVAVPDFPHTSGEVGDGNRADIVNQPADLSYVADQVISGTRPSGGPSPWPGLASDTTLGIVGHSDGGLTATAFAYNDRYRDPRVSACVSLTGGLATTMLPGPYLAASPADIAPLLVVHGTGDTTNPYSASSSLFASHPGGPDAPKYLLTLDNGDHIGPYMFDTASVPMADVVAAFLQASLTPGTATAPPTLAPPTAPGLQLESG